jgi:hypothetical protein
MKTASGLVVPDGIVAGRHLFLWNAQKGIVQGGTVVSVGESTVQLQIDGGPEQTVRWTELHSDAASAAQSAE